MRRTGWIPLALALAACGPARVGGVVDGDRVGGARTAIFDTIELFGSDTVVVVLSDVPDGCNAFEDIYDALLTNADCDDVCDDLERPAKEYLGRKTYWTATITSFTTGSVEDDYDYEDGPLGDEEFNLSFSWYDAGPLYDPGDCEDTCDDGDLLDPDTEHGNSGDLEIVEYDSRDVVRGRFEVNMGGGEELRGSFTAEYCDMSDWFPWF